jgi:glycosyltransferase involved in cell wall biosynthesis
MGTNTIATITPAHPFRARNGMLDRALRSIQMQTLLPDEIIVAIDNDSEGAAPTRQRALMRATTDWVAMLDSDDMFLQPHLEKLLAHALATGADFVYSWFMLLAQDGTLYEEYDPIFPPTHFTNPWNPDDPIETTITTLVRRELAQEVGFFPAEAPGGTNPGANSGEDRRFTIECMRRGARIEHLVERTWIWAHHGANTSGLPGRGDSVIA